MRTLILASLLVLAPIAARAEPQQEARSATSACLSAVIDGAPVGDIDGDDVSIRRGVGPVSCTVRVTGGEPVVIREAVLAAIKQRSDLFTPAHTRWASGEDASRETFCNLSARRALNAAINTGKPGRQPVLTVTVFELPKRDARCDQDMGLQSAEASPPVIVAATPAPEPAAPPVAEPPKAKKGWRLPRVPSWPFGKD